MEVCQLQCTHEKPHLQTESPRSLWTMQVSRDGCGNAGKCVESWDLTQTHVIMVRCGVLLLSTVNGLKRIEFVKSKRKGLQEAMGQGDHL